MSKPLILVSNDDGYNAKGISNLIELVKPYGEVLVVAPEKGESGMSHAITIKRPLRLTKIHEEKDLRIYSCSGTPVDSVKLALNQLLDRKPDILVSGINHGSNASISVIYSGTMGAVIEGCFNGIPSIGFSVCDHDKNADFNLAVKYSKIIFEDVLKNGLPPGICLNVNYPVIDIDKVKGIKVCRQTNGVWKEEFEKRTDPYGENYYWLTGSFRNAEPENTKTDEWALANNYVAVVPVKVDLTAENFINDLQSRL